MDLPDLGKAFARDSIEFIADRPRWRVSKVALLKVFDRVNHLPEALNNIALRLILNNDGNVEAAYEQWVSVSATDRKPRGWDRLSLLERRVFHRIAIGESAGLTSVAGRRNSEPTYPCPMSSPRCASSRGRI